VHQNDWHLPANIFRLVERFLELTSEKSGDIAGEQSHLIHSIHLREPSSGCEPAWPGI
jgi:hypothetical protein